MVKNVNIQGNLSKTNFPATWLSDKSGDCVGSGLNGAGKCAASVETLIGSSAGLAAASGKIADKCFKTVP